MSDFAFSVRWAPESSWSLLHLDASADAPLEGLRQPGSLTGSTGNFTAKYVKGSGSTGNFHYHDDELAAVINKSQIMFKYCRTSSKDWMPFGASPTKQKSGAWKSPGWTTGSTGYKLGIFLDDKEIYTWKQGCATPDHTPEVAAAASTASKKKVALPTACFPVAHASKESNVSVKITSVGTCSSHASLETGTTTDSPSSLADEQAAAAAADAAAVVGSTTPGNQWIPVLRQRDGEWFEPETTMVGTESGAGPFCDLNIIEKHRRDDGRLTLLLRWPGLNDDADSMSSTAKKPTSVMWSQERNPATLAMSSAETWTFASFTSLDGDSEDGSVTINNGTATIVTDTAAAAAPAAAVSMAAMAIFAAGALFF